MKTLKVIDVVNINRIFDNIVLQGAPLADIKAVVKFRAESRPTIDAWDAIIKDTISKLKGETITEDELNKQLNEALSDEAVRDVEITPLSLSEEAEIIILANSKITPGNMNAIKALLNKGDEKQ